MGTGSSDSPRAEAASAQEAVCASDSASPKATRSHCSRFSVHRHRDAQQQQQSSGLRRRRRGPVHAARTVGSKVQRSISKRQKQLQDLEKDLLCLRIFNELLPDQLVSEVRQQLQAGAGQAAAVERVAKKRLAGADVRKLFLALAGTLSASCAVVHIAKGLVCSVARPLRLRRSVGLLVNPVLMPTSLYGPLLGAYVITLAARGALRQMALEVQQEQRQHGADAAGDNAAAAADSEAAAGEQTEEAAGAAGDAEHAADAASSSSASTARRIAMYQHAVRTSSTSVAESVPQALIKVRAGTGSESSSNSNSPRVAPLPGQQQQQQESKSKPWWAFWKRSQRNNQQQQQTDEGGSSAAPSSGIATCDTAAPQNSSSSNAAQPAPAAAVKCPSLPPTPGRQDTAAALAAVALAAASVSPAAGSPRSVDSCSSSGALQHHQSSSSSSTAVPPLPAGGQHSAVLRSVMPPQQQQAEEAHVPAAYANGSSDAPQQQLATNAHSTATATSRFAAAAAAPAGAFDHAECQQTSTEQPSAAAEDHADDADDADDRTNQHLDADQQQQLSVRTRAWASRQAYDASAAAGGGGGSESDVCSPCMAELEGQVSKLQRRWSSADNEAFVDELQAAQLRKAPFRPPVFSRLASGKGGCRITAAAAAQTAEEACGGCGGACGGAVSPNAAAAAAPAGAVSPQRTVSLDLGSERHVMLQLEQQGPAEVELHAAAAAVPAGSAVGAPVDVEVCMLGSKQQQPLQMEQHQRTYKSLDWGHKLMTL